MLELCCGLESSERTLNLSGFESAVQHFDGDVFAIRYISGQPDRRVCAVAKTLNHLIAIVNMIFDCNGVIASHTISFQFFHSFDRLIKVMRRIIAFGRLRHKSSSAEGLVRWFVVMLGLKTRAKGVTGIILFRQVNSTIQQQCMPWSAYEEVRDVFSNGYPDPQFMHDKELLH